MLGAIAGDIIGSPYERRQIKTIEFPLIQPACAFTDDSVMSVAVAETLLEGGDYVESYHRWFRRYPNAGYGKTFGMWALRRDTAPYGSFGNGSAMRAGPVGYAFDTLEETLAEARRSACVTHDHPEGVKGAQAVAAAIFMSRMGEPIQRISAEITRRFDYDLSQPLNSIRPHYGFDVTCQGTVPIAIRAVMEADSWECAVRLAVSMGGDSDTLACIAGAIAEPVFGGVPEPIAEEIRRHLEKHGQPLLEVTDAFLAAYGA